MLSGLLHFEVIFSQNNQTSQLNALQIAFNIVSICIIWPNFQANCLKWPPVWQFWSYQTILKPQNSYFITQWILVTQGKRSSSNQNGRERYFPIATRICPVTLFTPSWEQSDPPASPRSFEWIFYEPFKYIFQ